jgi:M6 family metalloprotease-like protein
MFVGFAFMFIVALNLIFLSACVWAAPFSKNFHFTQPDGVQLTLWGEGDEFHAVFETTTGYTVVFNPKQKAYFYAKRAADGKSLKSSGVLAHKPVPPGLLKHARMDKDAVIAAAKARRKKWDAETGLSKRWSLLKSQTLGTPLASDQVDLFLAPPGTTTTGTKIGLTLLIDFPDDPATISQADIEEYLNSDSYTGFGNNGSVKEYFSDVSNSLLTYTNVVTIYVRMAQPKSYYNDTSLGTGGQARLLINDALTILKARSDYNSTILPTFNSLTTDTSNRVVAFNVFFAGENSGVWIQGLWPHSWVLASPVSLGNGKSVWRYQITDLSTSLKLGTFCHENGHMLVGFPDLYDYDYDSVGGAGVFSLMGSGGHGANPSQVDAYLKLAAGWATVTDVDSTSNLTGTLIAAPNSGYNHFYRYKRPGISTEYYLFENRQDMGRDANLPATGIAVWHVDELGDRDNQSIVPNSSHLNYELTLVQADNQWHFQNNINSGDSVDLYYQGNSAAAYTNILNDLSTPHAHWWDGTTSGINFNGVSVPSMSMTFSIGNGGSGLLPPVLGAEPSVTPGTENTIYWSAVSSMAASPLVVDPEPVAQVSSTSQSVRVPEKIQDMSTAVMPSQQTLIGISSAELDKGLNASHHPLQQAAETLSSSQDSFIDKEQALLSAGAVELHESRSKYGRYYKLSNGRHAALVSSVPVHNGASRSVDNNIVQDSSISDYLDVDAASSSYYDETHSYDDCYSWGAELFNYDTEYLKVGYNASYGAPYYMSFMTFHNINIPPGSTIDYVALYWKAYSGSSSVDSFKWQFEDTDDAQACAYAYPASRNYVNNYNYSSSYSTSWTAGSWYGVADFSAGLQDVIDRTGWSSGNSIGLKWSSYSASGGYRYIYSYDYGSSSAPYLYVEYTEGSGMPNLAPYQPSGWSDQIVVSNVTGTSTNNSPLYTTDTLYIDWAVINNGTAATAERFYTELYVDDVLRASWYTDPPLNSSNYTYVQDYSIGTLAAGTHTIRIKTDSTGVITEGSESDNEYTRTVTVVQPVLTEYFAESADNSSFISASSSGWITQTQWTFQNLTPGQTYWYRVKARSGTDESGWSNIEYSQQECTDTTPDAFTFTDQTNVALNTTVTSNTITVSGICAPAFISITGGTYSINGGVYTSTTGTVSNGDTVTVRQTSSGSYSTTTNATLTIGGVSDTFSVTTSCQLNTYYKDSDSDDFGNPNDTTTACTLPLGYVIDNTDCDDRPDGADGIQGTADEPCRIAGQVQPAFRNMGS